MRQYRRGLGRDLGGRAAGIMREVEEEIETHLAMRTEALIREGLSPEAARAEAERRFGDSARARARLASHARRASRRLRWKDAWAATGADVRQALRHARRAPHFTSAALLIFAVGVGLTTSVVSVADHVLLRPLPFPGSDRLVGLWSVAEQGGEFRWVSMANWVDWKDRARALGSAGLYASRRASVSTGSEALRVDAAEVAGAFFGTVRPAFVWGRGFTEDEAQAEAPLAVVSEGFWRRVLGGAADPGRVPLVVDGRPSEIVGVIREGQALPGSAEVWTPLSYRAGSGARRNNINYEAVARLAPGVTLEQARVELAGIARRIRTSDPEALYSWGVGVRPLRSVVVGEARGQIALLATAVGLLLLLSCANLAGLSLARARRRSHEVAVRQALGAGRRRILRQALADHLVLALVGGGAGVVLGGLATEAFVRRVGAWLPRASEIAFDGRFAAMGFAAAILAGILAGVAPAVQQSRRAPGEALSGGRGGIEGGRGLPGAALVAGEVALALALLVAGGLLLRSYGALVDRELGFDPSGVVTAEVPLVGEAYAQAGARAAFWEELRASISALPGVLTVSVATHIPTGDGARGFIDLPDIIGGDIGAGYFVVGRGYFRTLDIPLLEGRVFDETDGMATERVTVINRSMAERFWRGERAVGRRVRARSMEGFGRDAPWLTVVGVVGDVRQYGFESGPEDDMFVLDEQVPYYTRSMTVLVRGEAGAPAADALRAAVRRLDPDLAVEIDSLDQLLGDGTARRRAILLGLGMFGAMALFLVCVGVYGLISFAAEERMREMALRRALGAERWGVVRLMLVGAARVVLLGGAAGVVGARLLSELLRSQLVDLAPLDPVTYLAAAALLLAVGTVAALVPSMRAARRDPLVVLRRTTAG